MNYMKVLIIITSAIILAACSPDRETTVEIAKPDSADERPKSGTEHDDKKNSSSIPLESRLDFNRNISLISVSEINDEALVGNPVGGIASQNSHIINDEMLYLFYDAPLPTRKTELIILEDKFNNDYLLDHKLHYFDVNSASLSSKLESEYVNNENRLFSDSEIHIEQNDDGSVSISIDNSEAFELGPDETNEVERQVDGVESRLVFKNYGELNSVNNIMYEEISKDAEEALAEEFRRGEPEDNELEIDDD